jgi:hypothetical protein
MKKIVLFLIPIVFFSCGPTPETVIMQTAAKLEMVYFKDTTTNVCFSAIKYGKDASNVDYKTFTCVPCDSLKHVSIYKLGK